MRHRVERMWREVKSAVLRVCYLTGLGMES